MSLVLNLREFHFLTIIRVRMWTHLVRVMVNMEMSMPATAPDIAYAISCPDRSILEKSLLNLLKPRGNVKRNNKKGKSPTLLRVCRPMHVRRMHNRNLLICAARASNGGRAPCITRHICSCLRKIFFSINFTKMGKKKEAYRQALLNPNDSI